MYFVSIKKLKEDINSGKLSETSRLAYFLIGLLITLILMNMGGFGLAFPSTIKEFLDLEAKPNMWDAIIWISYTVIPFLGAIFAFRANNGGAGHDFLGKYFSIGFVVSIRLLPLYIIVIFASLIADGFLLNPEVMLGEEDVPWPSSALTTLPDMLMLSVLYWRICKHISDVANATPQTT